MSNPEMIRTAGAATPRGPKADIQEARKISLEENNTNGGACTILDQRLDDLIAIADLTGATLGDVVRTVGHLPEAIFAATIDVLAALAAPPAPTVLQDLLQAHRAMTDSLVDAKSDTSVEDIDRQIDELEHRIMATPARSATETYAKMLAIFPELWIDLQRPEYAALVVEIDGKIGAEVST